MNKKVQLQDLGNKDYKDTWDYQEALFKEIVDIKIKNRQSNSQLPTPNYLLYRDWETDRKSTRLNSSHLKLSRMPSSA